MRFEIDLPPQRITGTYVGQEFGWDSITDVNWEALRQARDVADLVLDNPHRYPNADIPALERYVDEIDRFLAEHSEAAECAYVTA